jgi:hypothetical protein
MCMHLVGYGCTYRPQSAALESDSERFSGVRGPPVLVSDGYTIGEVLTYGEVGGMGPSQCQHHRCNPSGG